VELSAATNINFFIVGFLFNFVAEQIMQTAICFLLELSQELQTLCQLIKFINISLLLVFNQFIVDGFH
ncbi:hypothetical protein CWC11_20830, partial [Pseudoalteromonas sp. S3178]|uniref:hypothetical protein n=1 Tax=Pseudoalteromonas sp. S3178 TaxID=579532 RepID=UPI00128A3099